MPDPMIEIEGMTVNDYLFCETCGTFVDWWKYATLEDTGHQDCKVRNVTPEELKECVEDCREITDHCLDCGEYLDSSREMHEGHNIAQESCLTEDFLSGPFKHGPLCTN